MQYLNAAAFRTSAPCTNVPIHCSLCPSGSSGQPTTFWKYCFVQHMVLHHVDENTRSSPPIPFDLLTKVHISLAEGKAMGINSDNIMKYRENFGIPNSDAFDTISPSKHWNLRQPLGRKRTGSEVSKSSTSSSGRDSSPTKVQLCNWDVYGRKYMNCRDNAPFTTS